MMNERRNNKEGKSNQYRDENSKNENMTRNVNSSKTSLYNTQQLENSLGKLQIESENALRKIIDTQPMDYDTRGQPDEYSRGDRRRLYQQLNEVENIAGVSLSVFYRKQLEVSDEDSRNAVNVIREHLCTKINYLMNLEKGRKLIKRLLEEDIDGRFADALLYAYPSINHRDEDQEHMPFLSAYLETASSETIVKLCRRYDGIIIWDKPMMVTILFLMMERMFVIWDSQEIPEDCLTEWMRFLADQADSVPPDTTLIARPLVQVNKPEVLRFLTFLFRHDNVSLVDKFLNILT